MTWDETRAPAESWTDRDPVAFHAGMRGSRLACRDLTTGETATYGELDDLVARAAGFLAASLEAPRGARVATLCRNGLDAVVLLYACERVGAIYTPLNWRLAAPEVAALVADCTPAFALVDPEFEAAAAAFGDAPTMTAAAFREAVRACAPARATPADPGAPLIILYTSGTTGRPKGVVLTRSQAFWGAFNFSAVGAVDGRSAMLCDSPMFHTVGLIATVRAVLHQGGTLLLSDRFLPARTLDRIADPALGVTHIFGVPQIAQMIADDPAYDPAKLRGLTGFFCGGAPLPDALRERFLDDGVPIVNGYGSTEGCTIAGMPIGGPEMRAKPGSAGLTAPAIDLRLVDADGREVAPGEVGEIWVRGPAVTGGYWNQPEATAAAFSDGWFKTGDAGRRDADGHLFVVDRWKDMYISGGENVYPAEVEAAIAALKGVAEVGVVGVPDSRWGEVGVAFVARGPEASVCDADVLAHCAARLARYKHPAAVRFVDALPRTGSGKIRKDELRRWAALAKTS